MNITIRAYILGFCCLFSIPCSAKQAVDVKAVLDDTVQMLEQVDPRMAQEMKNISPEQQKELEKNLGVVFDKMSEMSPEELQELEKDPGKLFDFVEQTVGEQTPAPQPEKTTDQPQTAPEPQPVQPEKTKQPELKKPTIDENYVVQVLEKLIQATEQLLAKVESLNLEEKTQAWVNNNLIAHWPSTLTAQAFNEKLRTFIKKLRIIKNEQDPKTKAYVYRKKLTEDESLVNNLQRMATTVTDALPKIVSPKRSLQDSLVAKLTPAAKQAAITAVQAYTEAFQVLDIEKSIDDIIKTYEPRAKELQKEEKKLKEQAEKATKLPRGKTGYATPSFDEYGLGAGSRPFDYDDDGFYDSDYDDYLSDIDGYTPSSFNENDTNGDAKKTANGEKTGGSALPSNGETKEKADDTKKGTGTETPDQYIPDEKKKKTARQIDQLMPEINFQLRDAATTLDVHRSFFQQLPTIPETMVNQSQHRDLQTMVKKTTQAVGLIEKVDHALRLQTKKQKQETKKEIQQAYKEHAAIFSFTQKQIQQARTELKNELADLEKAAQTKIQKSAPQAAEKTTTAPQKAAETPATPESQEKTAQPAPATTASELTSEQREMKMDSISQLFRLDIALQKLEEKAGKTQEKESDSEKTPEDRPL